MADLNERYGDLINYYMSALFLNNDTLLNPDSPMAVDRFGKILFNTIDACVDGSFAKEVERTITSCKGLSDDLNQKDKFCEIFRTGLVFLNTKLTDGITLNPNSTRESRSSFFSAKSGIRLDNFNLTKKTAIIMGPNLRSFNLPPLSQMTPNQFEFACRCMADGEQAKETYERFNNEITNPQDREKCAGVFSIIYNRDCIDYIVDNKEQLVDLPQEDKFIKIYHMIGDFQQQKHDADIQSSMEETSKEDDFCLQDKELEQ